MLLLSWALLGGLIGVTAAQRKGFSIVVGVLGGLMLARKFPFQRQISRTLRSSSGVAGTRGGNAGGLSRNGAMKRFGALGVRFGTFALAEEDHTHRMLTMMTGRF